MSGNGASKRYSVLDMYNILLQWYKWNFFHMKLMGKTKLLLSCHIISVNSKKNKIVCTILWPLKYKRNVFYFCPALPILQKSWTDLSLFLVDPATRPPSHPPHRNSRFTWCPINQVTVFINAIISKLEIGIILILRMAHWGSKHVLIYVLHP